MDNFKTRKMNIIFFLTGLFLGVILTCLIHAYLVINNDNFLISNSSSKGAVNKELYLYKVQEVIDGDTLRVKINPNKTELVRLLGINTPEVEGKYRHQECYGPEASARTKQLLNNKLVYLLPDPQAPDEDKYGRWLRYVFLDDGEFINADLVRDGYAQRYIYQPIQFGDYFAELEKIAQDRHLGLWGPACEYFKKLRE